MSGDRSKRMPPAEMAESPSLSVRNRYWHTRISEQEKELERMRAVYDAAMALSDEFGDLWIGWFIAPDKLPEQYRLALSAHIPIVEAVDALVRECRRAKEGK